MPSARTPLSPGPANSTLPAVDVGGGVDVLPPGRSFLRVDVSDRLVKYPGPVFSTDRRVSPDGFFGHDVRVAAGAGLRF